MEIVKKKLENLVVRAPIAGHLTSLNAEVGESKSRGERLGQIDVLEGFKIRAEVDEYYIARISVGQKGEVKIAGEDIIEEEDLRDSLVCIYLCCKGSCI